MKNSLNRFIDRMFRIVVSLFLGLIGAIGILLGAQGLYVYFNFAQIFLGGGGTDKLFLFLEVPMEWRGIVALASSWGMQSWVFPVLILIVGILVLKWSHIITLISDWLGS